jgi:hypothetical protein
VGVVVEGRRRAERERAPARRCASHASAIFALVRIACGLAVVPVSRVLTVRRRLGNRQHPDHDPHHQRPRHGHPPARSPRRPGDLLRQGRPVHVVGVQPEGPRHGPRPVDRSRWLPYDNAVVEAFWGRMQVELFNRKTWRPASSSPPRSTTTSSCSTTPDAATRRSACSHPPSTRTACFHTHNAA